MRETLPLAPDATASDLAEVSTSCERDSDGVAIPVTERTVNVVIGSDSIDSRSISMSAENARILSLLLALAASEIDGLSLAAIPFGIGTHMLRKWKTP